MVSEYKAIRRQRTILEFIVRYKTENDGVAPSLREIGAATGTSSTSVVRSQLEKLEQRGALVLGGGFRNIRVVGGEWHLPHDDEDVSSRSIPFETQTPCDNCGAIGAFDFMGDYLCEQCAISGHG